MNVHINTERLLSRIDQLGRIGALPGGGCKRLALSAEDAEGRALVTGWFRTLGLEIHTDVIGNTWAIRRGRKHLPPLVLGSHIDTVATGGLYDGVLGVLGGLEVIESVIDAGIDTEYPLAVAFFTNEEGARFAPDMMGSGVSQGGLELGEMLGKVGIDGKSVGDALDAIGARGSEPVGALTPSAYLELHIEQGPVLESECLEIGVVTGVQGISWTEFTISGRSSHAGTTPMALRRDAGAVAAAIATEARAIARDFGPPQVATVGRMSFTPDLVNVVPEQAVLTVDLRHTDEATLKAAEKRLFETAEELASAEGCTLARQTLARFEPVAFDTDLVDQIVSGAVRLGLSHRKMPSGAGHDAQMFAPNCPSAMIFVPSQGGISHNIHEFTAPEDLANGVRLLAEVALERACVVQPEGQTA
ncbi:Zn-dependent hydrolase [Tropicimonas isoalkanivorans]|uniref:N-carbamoyl-L-amino-acid hydrolase n=1 Tax=Tropicimonas isoalkanivorans TaxID=441112 RepID=A0A1I1DHM2_9RHOB|nr:Zn-dependent hydrolase [Tropicimonas isoalkanivorans]SFB74324.1 N-carbamoyl-L-amino-acid hydrolase [Tropicimonas isoalkanivorans]